MRWFRTLLCLSALCGMLAVAVPAQAQFTNMAASVPNDANVLMLLSVDRILKSEIAQKQDWASKFGNAYAAGLTHIPTDASRVLVATQVDLEYLNPEWHLAVIETTREPSLPYIAKNLKGRVDSIGGVPAISLPNDTYIVQLTPTRLATYAPADRQEVGRWLSSIRARSAIGISAYLRSALDLAAHNEADIVQAIDLEYSVPLDAIRKRLDSVETLKGSKTDLDKLAALLASIKGLTLSVQIESDINGEIAVDFGDDTAMLATIGKPMLLEALKSRDAIIEDLETWEAKAQGTQLLLKGPLTAAGLRKVLSLIEQPIPDVKVAPPAATTAPPVSEEKLKLTASQQYFTAMNALLREAASEYRRATTVPQGAMWLERIARRIDRLPLLNVDPDLLAYGQATARTLRGMASAIRGTGAETSAMTAQVVQEGQAYSDFGFSPGNGWGGGRYGWGNAFVEWRDVQGERLAIRAEQRNKQAQAVIQGKEQIENATQAIRAKMTQRFMAEF